MARSTAFYRDGLGLPTKGDFEDVSFFKLRGTGSLFPRDEMEKDADASAASTSTSTCGDFGGFTPAHNVGSKQEVAQVPEQAKVAGAKILKPAQDAF